MCEPLYINSTKRHSSCYMYYNYTCRPLPLSMLVCQMWKQLPCFSSLSRSRESCWISSTPSPLRYLTCSGGPAACPPNPSVLWPKRTRPLFTFSSHLQLLRICVTRVRSGNNHLRFACLSVLSVCTFVAH